MLAKMDKENGVTDAAAICSTIAANMYGLDILQEDIQNNNQNRTRFAALSKEMIIPKKSVYAFPCLIQQAPYTAFWHVLQ